MGLGMYLIRAPKFIFKECF